MQCRGVGGLSTANMLLVHRRSDHALLLELQVYLLTMRMAGWGDASQLLPGQRVLEEDDKRLISEGGETHEVDDKKRKSTRCR